MKEFAEKFRRLRKEKGLTQERIAEVFAVSPQAVSRWENDTASPDVALLPAIAGFFGITVDELLGVSVARKQHKLMFIQGFWNKSYDDEVNKHLSDGWIVKDLQTHAPGEGCNIQGFVVLERIVYKNED